MSPPPGPQFIYEAAPSLFGRRRGYGPLHIVWDTNLLIDYFEHGRAVWQFATLPDSAHGRYELEALQLILALWVIRDLRFQVVPRFVVDAKKQLSAERRVARINALHRFTAALQLVGGNPSEVPSPEGLLVLPEAERIRALNRIPHTLDRNLITDALALGAHVFMTNEKRLVARSPDLMPFGLRIASPGDLLEDLCACGAFHCLIAPSRYALWPLPDQARVTHLLDALPDDQQP